MKNQPLRPATILALISLETLLLAGILIASVNQYYPTIGMDYKYFVPRLIDSFLHYQVNGFSIQWYTPSFGGGLPSFPNPQQIQFSLPQFFTQFFDPYLAILISIFTFVLIGITSSYYLFSNLFGFNHYASLLSGILFLANGFYFQHIGVGHLTFITLPLLPLLLVGMLRNRQPLLNGALIGLIFASMLHHGSFYLIVYFVLSASLSISLLYLVRAEAFNGLAILKNCLIGVLFTAALSASKLTAVFHFLRFFPRHIEDQYQNTITQALISIPYQLFGSMSLRPLGLVKGFPPKNIWDILMTLTGSELAFWELDISITPLVWIIILFGVGLLAVRIIRGQVQLSRTHFVALGVFLISLEITIEFIISNGIFYLWLSQLPILNSLHVNPRYTIALVYPLVILAAATINFVFSDVLKNNYPHFVFFLAALGLALIPLYFYFEMPMDKLGRRQFNVEGSQEIYRFAQAGETFPVQKVASDMNDARVFDQFASNLNPYEVLFGYELSQFKHQLVEGSPYLESDERFNFTDPTSLVFPQSTSSQPFDRFLTMEKSKLDGFLSRIQPNWKIPAIQQAAVWVSGIAIVITVLVLAFYLIKNTFKEEFL